MLLDTENEMTLSVHWSHQTLSEITCAMEAGEQSMAATVLYLAQLLDARPMEWQLLIEEATRIKYGGQGHSYFESPEQTMELARDFANYVIYNRKESHGLFSL